MSAARDRLAAARLLAARRAPYLAAALWALVPVERPGIATMAVDAWWRLYYDPAAVEAWSVEEVAGVLVHEVTHLLRRHHARLGGFPPEVGNLAADAEENDDLLRDGWVFPRTHPVTVEPIVPITPSVLGLPPERLAEEYAAALLERTPPRGGAGGDGAGDEEPAPESASSRPSAGGNESPEDPAAGSSAAGQGGGEGADPNSNPSGSGSQNAGAPAADRGAAPGSQSGAASGNAGAPAAEARTPVGNHAARLGGSSGSGRGAGSTAGGPGAGSGNATGPGSPSLPEPTFGGGSGSHGHRMPWEDPEPGEPGAAPGLTAHEAELVRRRVAEEIRRSSGSESRGTAPGHWRRWAEAVLSPRIPWHRELRAAVRAAIRDRAGAADYSWRRPNRRQEAYGEFVMPSLRQPVPEVAVVIDTSGSMSDEALGRALAEVEGVLRALGHHEVTLVVADATVHVVRRVRSLAEARRQLTGWGGTDMTVALASVERLRPRPEVAVVLTDCHTPWPEQPPAGMRVIVARIGSGKAPAWARVIDVEEVAR